MQRLLEGRQPLTSMGIPKGASLLEGGAYYKKYGNDCWNMCASSYLNELRQQYLYQESKNISEKLIVGDIVLICHINVLPESNSD